MAVAKYDVNAASVKAPRRRMRSIRLISVMQARSRVGDRTKGRITVQNVDAGVRRILRHILCPTRMIVENVTATVFVRVFQGN